MQHFRQISLPKYKVEEITSEENQRLFYRIYKGEDYNPKYEDQYYQEVFDQVHEQILFLFYMFLGIQYLKKNEWVFISSIFWTKLFGFKKYNAVKTFFSHILNMDVYVSRTSSKKGMYVVSQEKKAGCCKRFQIDIEKNWHVAKKENIKLSDTVSERIDQAISASPDYIAQQIEEMESRVKISDDAPDELKKEFHGLKKETTVKKGDDRAYTLGSRTSREMRPYLHFKGDPLHEVDVKTMFPKIHAYICYQGELTYDEIADRNALNFHMNHGDFYQNIADDSGYTRDEIKPNYSQLVNSQYTHESEILNGDDEIIKAIFEFLKIHYPSFARFIAFEFNTKESAKKHLHTVSYNKYGDTPSVAYRIGALYEQRLIKKLLQYIITNHSNIGLLHVHDGVYVPSRLHEELSRKLDEFSLDTFDDFSSENDEDDEDDKAYEAEVDKALEAFKKKREAQKIEEANREPEPERELTITQQVRRNLGLPI